MTKHFEPGQTVTINDTANGLVPLRIRNGSQATYIQLLKAAGYPLPYPHEVEFEGNILVLADSEVSA